MATAANEAFFCDCYRNMGHFLCSVEGIRRFVNVLLHCIVSNVPSKVRKYSGPPELLRSEIKSPSRALATFQSNGSAPKTRSHFKEMCILIRYSII